MVFSCTKLEKPDVNASREIIIVDKCIYRLNIMLASLFKI